MYGIIVVTAQTLNNEETAKLKLFLTQESEEPGTKNFQQLGIQDLETVDWETVTGLVWNINGRLDSMRWQSKKLGGDLDLSGFAEIRYIRCDFNRLNTINVMGCAGLLYFDCYNNNFTSLDVSTNIHLEQFCCRWQYVELKELDLTNNPKLWHFCGTGNKFESLDISNNPELINFYCAATNLKTIDVSKNPKLQRVYLRGNQLIELDFSNHPDLEYLTCYDNQLQTLDVSGCPNLKTLLVYNNQLKEIKIDYLEMDELNCQHNYLSFSNIPELQSCEVFMFNPQKTIQLSVPSNIVDFSNEYRIGGIVSDFNWTNNYQPTEIREGVFSVDNSYKNLTCWMTNSRFPGLILTCEIELLATQSVDMLQETDVYAIGNLLYLKTNRPVTAEIYMVSGALAQQFTIVEGEYAIPMTAGIYIVKFSNGVMRKVVIR